MSEPIFSTITIAVPDWYVEALGAALVDNRSQRLRQVTEWLDGEIYGMNEPGGDPVAGRIWQCSGDIHYGISLEVQEELEILTELEIEFDAHADEYCEFEGERFSWRAGWAEIRRWTATPNECAMTESQYKELRATHLDQFPIDYLGFVEALDAFWPPPLLIEAEEGSSAAA